MANVDIKLGYKDSAWFTANAAIILKVGQIVYLEQTGTYKIGDGVTALSALSFLGGSSTTPNLQEVTDEGNEITNDINFSDGTDVVGTIGSTGVVILESNNTDSLFEIDRVNNEVKIGGVVTASTPTMFNASKGLKSLTATVWGAFIAALTGKTTPVDADSIDIIDSAASGVAKKVSLTNLWTNWLKPKTDAIYSPTQTLTDISSTSTIVGWSAFTIQEIHLHVNGNVATVIWWLSGTGTGTIATFTVPVTAAFFGSCLPQSVNNGAAAVAGRATISPSTSLVDLRSSVAGAAYSGAGSRISAGSMTFII